MAIRTASLCFGVFAWASVLFGAHAQSREPGYTVQEYAAFQAAHREQDAQTRLGLLDVFVARYPRSALLPFAYRDYYQAHYARADYAECIEYADKLLELGEEVSPRARIEAIAIRSQSYLAGLGDKVPDVPEARVKARTFAAEGLRLAAEASAPADMTEEQFAKERENMRNLFTAVIARTSPDLP
jgi:hypothetical protein